MGQYILGYKDDQDLLDLPVSVKLKLVQILTLLFFNFTLKTLENSAVMQTRRSINTK